jgi:hypothetical protein
LKKKFQDLDGFNANISTKAAVDKFKRPKAIENVTVEGFVLRVIQELRRD